VEVRTAGGSVWTARPLLWRNPKSEQLVANPDLLMRPTHDVYIAPIELNPGRPPAPGNTIDLGKGESHQVAGMTVTFEDFDRGADHGAAGAFSVGARLVLTGKGGPKTVIVPRLRMGEQGLTSTRESLTGTSGVWVEVAGINADLGRVRLTLGGLPAAPGDPGQGATFTAEVTIKPGISLVWLGLLLLLVGATLALVRRTREASVTSRESRVES
jgi:cytochrome c-type biogenesis protein CcmF